MDRYHRELRARLHVFPAHRVTIPLYAVMALLALAATVHMNWGNYPSHAEAGTSQGAPR
jgi:hypothetical protein